MNEEKVKVHISKALLGSGTPNEVLSGVYELLLSQKWKKLHPFETWKEEMAKACGDKIHTNVSREMRAILYLLEAGCFTAHLWFADGTEEDVPPKK
jgi:hypothetical protein